MMAKCKCKFCRTYKYYKWAVVMECGCGCHTEDGMTGHDGLCCEFPNGLKKNNPYKKLKSAKEYLKIIQQWEDSVNLITTHDLNEIDEAREERK